VLVDQANPTFYDHADHVPGPLLLEASRQAAIAEAVHAGLVEPAGAVLAACTAHFDKYADSDVPVECSATVPAEAVPAWPAAVEATATFRQSGAIVADMTLRLTTLEG
jgi:2-oxo-3-(phosphooxy)propyl 3-oxoalkanoate synthase